MSNDTKVKIKFAEKEQNHKSRAIILIILSVIAYVILFFISPENNEICAFKRVTGFYSASCGITRASHSLARFRFLQAFYYNRFFTILFPLVLYSVIAYIVNSLSNRKVLPLPPKNIMILLIITACILFFIYGVLLNIPHFEFLLPRQI